jgi:phosphotransferase system  glucose/maltose/N-acetylglucosamine-specific IIC component
LRASYAPLLFTNVHDRLTSGIAGKCSESLPKGIVLATEVGDATLALGGAGRRQAGIFTAVLIILAGLGVCPSDSGQFAVWYAAGHAIFYFLPIFVGYYAAKKLGVTPLVGAILGAALLEPNFTALQTGDPKSFFSIPIVAVDYSSTIVPSLLAVWVTSFLERFLNAHMAKNLRGFLVPAIDLAVMFPLTVLVLGPIGNAVANGAGSAINYLVSANMVVTGIVMGGFWSLLVIFGVHWAIIPIIMANLTANGGDPIFALAAATIADLGCVRLALVPAEVTYAFGQELRDASAVPVLMCGCADGYLGYAVDRAEYGRFFESYITVFPKGAADEWFSRMATALAV